jgi:superfamily II DNA helicase RecQ
MKFKVLKLFTKGKRSSRLFRNLQQKEALCIASYTKWDMVVVLPMGAGKSLLFVVPVLNIEQREKRATLVVMPFVAIGQDMTRRCRELNICCKVMDKSTADIDPDKYQVVFCTYESLDTNYPKYRSLFEMAALSE